MSELNKILKDNSRISTWADLLNIMRHIASVYSEALNNAYPDEFDHNFTLNTLAQYQDIFPKIQALVETNLTIPMEQRIEITSNVTDIIAFILAINELTETQYKQYKSDILFEFVTIIGRFYIENLKKYFGILGIK